jgi:hypothetical protein
MMTTNFASTMLFPLCVPARRLMFTTHTNMQRFKENEFEVVRKDGLVFLREMAAEVKNFMDFKMSAVMVSHLLQTDW